MLFQGQTEALSISSELDKTLQLTHFTPQQKKKSCEAARANTDLWLKSTEIRTDRLD